MKVMTSTVPISDAVRQALATREGRASLLDFINARAAGKADRLRLVTGDQVIELTVGPGPHPGPPQAGGRRRIRSIFFDRGD